MTVETNNKEGWTWLSCDEHHISGELNAFPESCRECAIMVEIMEVGDDDN